MRRKLLFITGLILLSSILHSQVFEPVSWTFSSEKTGKDSFEMVMTATIDEGWHLYSIDLPQGGPVATKFTFEEPAGYTLDGRTYEVTKPEIKYDNSFEMNIGMHSGKAEFRQKIKLTEPSAKVKGYVTFMSCNDKECLPPRDVEFLLQIGEKVSAHATEEGQSSGTVQATDIKTVQSSQAVTVSGNESSGTKEQDNDNAGGKGLLRFFLLSLLAGFLGVLTPCVFPMIPLTVAFFSQGTAKKRSAFLQALIFGLTIILVYSSLGVIVSLTSAGAGFANTISTHWIPNLIFFVLFVVFAASFFGAFEIVMPAKWISSTDSKVDRGGAFAALFLGVTTVLVSFSCTGPIVGALLVEASTGEEMRPTIGMFGFGLAFALPFTLFALFPSLMNKLPKSGGWLNSIKVVLAFVMLALSLKFASTIDTVYSLGILSRDIYLIIWIIIFILLGIYLMGKIRFAHDSEVKHVGFFRLLLIIASFSFALYLVPGLFGAPLTRISALLPPRETSGFNLMKAISENKGASPAVTTAAATCEAPKYADFLHFDYGLQGYFDLDQALACAKKLNKPVLIDFKGHACANCKKMDAQVWSDPEVQKLIRENFVLAGLYVDDRTKLPENEVFISKIDGKEKKTIGKKNEDIEITMFKTNSLPLYAIVDPSGKLLIETRGTDFDIRAYIAWLTKGIKTFENR